MEGPYRGPMEPASIEDHFSKVLSARIVAARKSAGLVPKQVASALGIGEKRYYHWESATAKPKLTELPALVRTLKTSADALLFGEPARVFTPELQAKLQALDGARLRAIENSIRAILDMDPLPKQGHENTGTD